MNWIAPISAARHWRKFFLAALLLPVALFPIQQAVAQTADQLAIFNGLDATQQQTILQSLGQGGASGKGTSNETSKSRESTGNEERRRERPVEEQRRLVRDALQAEDTVLVEIDFPGLLPPSPIPTQGSNQQAQTTKLREPVSVTEREKSGLQSLIDQIRARNPYRLTRDGALLLPGFAAIPLQGLTVEQATARVAAEPFLQKLQVRITMLPLEKTGTEGLKRFGYDLFDQAPSTFAPVTDVPVPADYIVGAGDQITVQLYGNQNRTVKLQVGRDGKINFPELGPIQVGGKTFTSLQAELESRVARQMIGVNASVSMGETRSIRVFVLGEARLPGSYTVSGLSSMTAALFASGGIKPIGTLRNIQLKRQGKVVRTLDLYDLLLNGDTSDDAKLLPGDVIFVPPVGLSVAVQGEVRRPAIYEIKSTQTVADAVALAGGLNAEADTSKVSLERIDAERKRVVLDVDLTSRNVARLRDGDVISISRVVPTLDSGVSVAGHVFAPRSVAWRSGLRLSDVISSLDDLKPNADIHYVIIRRELPPDRRVAVLSADLAAAIAIRGGAADVQLMPRDQITVFDFETDRARIIKPILDSLKLQADVSRPTAVVRVVGRIKVPGDYPLEPGMRVSDLLRAGGNLEDAAYASKAELTRYVEREGRRVTELVTIDLDAMARGDASADLLLQPSDLLNIKELPQWADQDVITLRGEVRFPGTYTIQRGETLRSVIERAGGLTDLAFTAGSVFTRQELKEREQQQLDLLATRMQNDLATLALQAAQTNQSQSTQTLSVGQSILAQLKQSKAVGRLVIDLDHIMANEKGADGDVALRNGDMLMVPKQRQEVTVIGEVQSLTSHLYRKGLDRDDYIALSGGTTRKADKKQIYVVHANGSVVARQNDQRWFRSNSKAEMQPGDTVVVPLDTERMPALPMWQAITQIIYNVAIAAAALNSF